MYRKAGFCFRNSKKDEYFKGTVEFVTEKDGAMIEMDWMTNGISDHVAGNFCWLINGLGMGLMDENAGELQDEGPLFVEVHYYGNSSEEQKVYRGFTDELGLVKYHSLHSLYEVVRRIAAEPEHIHQS